MIADEAVSMQNNQITNHVGRACSNAGISWPVSAGRYQLAGIACAVASKHAHTHSIGRGGSAPPLPEVSEKAIWFPVWQISHPEHVDLPDSKIEVPDFLSEFQHLWGGKINVTLSRQTTHVRVHAGPHARRTYPGIAFIDTGSSQQYFVQVLCLIVESVRRID